MRVSSERSLSISSFQSQYLMAVGRRGIWATVVNRETVLTVGTLRGGGLNAALLGLAAGPGS